MSAIASFSTVAVAAPTTASRSNVAKRYARIFIRRETDASDVATTTSARPPAPFERRSVRLDRFRGSVLDGFVTVCDSRNHPPGGTRSCADACADAWMDERRSSRRRRRRATRRRRWMDGWMDGCVEFRSVASHRVFIVPIVASRRRARERTGRSPIRSRGASGSALHRVKIGLVDWWNHRSGFRAIAVTDEGVSFVSFSLTELRDSPRPRLSPRRR